jgi:hypothetical protein
MFSFHVLLRKNYVRVGRGVRPMCARGTPSVTLGYGSGEWDPHLKVNEKRT